MANEMLTRGCSLKYGTGGTKTEITNMTAYPDLGQAPDTVEVTNLSDTMKRYIMGLTDTGQLEFTFNYERGSTGNFAKATAITGVQTWELTFADTLAYNFTGEASVRMNGGSPGEAMTWTLAITVNSAITPTVPSTLNLDID